MKILMSTQEYINLFNSVYNEKQNNLEAALTAIKIAGASQMNSVTIIAMRFNIPLSEADKIILNSPTWSKESDATLKLREQIDKTIDNTNLGDLETK